LEAKEGSILIDPFDKEIGLKPPRVKDDLILVTHQHHDHNNIEGANPEAFVITNPGEYEKNGVYVKALCLFMTKLKARRGD